MPRLSPRQQPRETDPQPRLIDGLIIDGRDALSAKRAESRARLENDRTQESKKKIEVKNMTVRCDTDDETSLERG